MGHYIICLDCNAQIGDIISHTMINGKCTVCNYSPCEDGEHVLYTGKQYAHICQTCGYLIDRKDKNGDGYCDCCGIVWFCYHENSEWICDPEFDTNYHYQKCTDCGEWLYESWSKHTPVNGICSVCGYVTDTIALGDPSGDGKINAKDSTLILQHVVGIIKESQAFDAAKADVSGDGKLNAKDATLILQYSVGLRDSFPAG